MAYESVEIMHSYTSAAKIMLADVDATTNWLFASREMTQCTAVNAELTRRHKLLVICHRFTFIKFIRFLLPQQLIKLNSFLRESGDTNRYSNSCLLNALTNRHISSNLMFHI